MTPRCSVRITSRDVKKQKTKQEPAWCLKRATTSKNRIAFRSFAQQMLLNAISALEQEKRKDRPVRSAKMNSAFSQRPGTADVRTENISILTESAKITTQTAQKLKILLRIVLK